MAFNARQVIHVIQGIMPIAAAFFMIAACSGGYHAANGDVENNVHRVDEDGAQALAQTSANTSDGRSCRCRDPILLCQPRPPVLDAQMEKAGDQEG